MTDHPDQATLFRIAAERLAGKPFTLSEYNHPAPLDAQAECVPMVASFAAAQDWDGVWLFDYASGSNAWGRQAMSGFFDIDTNPAKWGFVRAGAAIFSGRPGAGQSAAMRAIGANNHSPLPAIAKLHARYGDNMLRLLTAASNIRRNDLLQTQILGWQMGDSGLAPQTSPVQSQYRLTWSVDARGQGIYQANGQAQVYTGHAKRFAEITGDRIRIASPDFVALTITPLGLVGANDYSPLLITACGRCENTEMQFSPDRRTVGRNWGQAPVRIEAVRGSVVVPEGKWTCHALAPDGSPKQAVPISYENGRGTLALSPEYGTMWYLLQPER
jgi:hypothetical protein